MTFEREERIAFARIISDLIEADFIVEEDEMESFDKIRNEKDFNITMSMLASNVMVMMEKYLMLRLEKYTNNSNIANDIALRVMRVLNSAYSSSATSCTILKWKSERLDDLLFTLPLSSNNAFTSRLTLLILAPSSEYTLRYMLPPYSWLSSAIVCLTFVFTHSQWLV